MSRIATAFTCKLGKSAVWVVISRLVVIRFFFEQICGHHHFRASGRSLDSPKRRGAQAAFADDGDGRDDWLDSLDFDEGIMSEVNAHEIIDLLWNRLELPERKIFARLVEGMGTRQIGRTLHVSHQSVIRHRLKIAMTALTLGIAPVRVSSKSSP